MIRWLLPKLAAMAGGAGIAVLVLSVFTAEETVQQSERWAAIAVVLACLFTGILILDYRITQIEKLFSRPEKKQGGRHRKGKR